MTTFAWNAPRGPQRRTAAQPGSGRHCGPWHAWLACAGLMSGAVVAQERPEKPIRLVVPGAAGASAADVLSRWVAQGMSDHLRQTIVVDNRPGAGGILAAEVVARANPDGHTLLMGWNSLMSVMPSLHARLPFDPQKDFLPVGQAVRSPFLMVVHPSLPATSVGDFLAQARARPGKINYASAGVGSGAHLCAELLRHMAAIDIVHVPYKGATPAMNELMAGEVQMMITSVAGPLPFVRAGKLRALGVTSARRLASLPDVPAIAETVSGYDVTTWYGVFAPAGTPAPVIVRLHAALRSIEARPDGRERMWTLGAELAVTSPEMLAQTIRQETVRWAKLVKAAGIKAQ